MAFVPERMDEERIANLSEKIASLYMNGKNSLGVEDYISTFMDVYDAAKKIIVKREQDKINSINNISVEQLMNEAAIEEDVEQKSTRGFF